MKMDTSPEMRQMLDDIETYRHDRKARRAWSDVARGTEYWAAVELARMRYLIPLHAYYAWQNETALDQYIKLVVKPKNPLEAEQYKDKMQQGARRRARAVGTETPGKARDAFFHARRVLIAEGWVDYFNSYDNDGSMSSSYFEKFVISQGQLKVRLSNHSIPGDDKNYGGARGEIVIPDFSSRVNAKRLKRIINDIGAGKRNYEVSND